jgi:hypothetical protein
MNEAPHHTVVRSTPKADVHVHQESAPRLDRVLSRRAHRPGYDWSGWRAQVLDSTPPGMDRLRRLGSAQPVDAVALDQLPDHLVARLVDLFEEAAGQNAVLVEVRVGRRALQRGDFMKLFRAAEQTVQAGYPNFNAVPVALLKVGEYPPAILTELVACCVDLAGAGLAGIDMMYQPYAQEADWAPMRRVAEQAVAAGLGITVHAGEFSPANIRAALQLPGLSRIGHAVHAVGQVDLERLLRRSGVTVELCLTSNTVLGAVSEPGQRLRRLLDLGVPVALGSDDPVRLGTSIADEYAYAAATGLSPAELLALTANAINASFAPAERRAQMSEVLAAQEGVPS